MVKLTKQWRKKSDVKDIVEAMNEVEKEKLTGGERSLMKNDELFFVDKGDSLSAQVKKSRKGLRIDDILAPNKHVKSYGIQKKTNKETGTADKKLVQKKMVLLEKGAPVNKSNVKGLGQSRSGKFDAWAEDPNKGVPIFEGGYDNPRAKLPKKIPKRIASSDLPAVRFAHPGNSYNPNPADHAEILSIATNEELNKIKKDKKLTKLIGRAAKNVTEQAKNYGFLESIQKETSIDFADDLSRTDGLLEAPELNQLIENLRTKDDMLVGDVEEEGETQEVVVKQTNAVKEPVNSEDRKTKKEKKKEKRRIDQARAERKKKIQKLRNKKFEKLPQITKGVEEALKEQEEKSRARKEKLSAEEKTKTKRLGKQEFVQPDIDVMLPNELPSSLRKLKPEGSLMRDRSVSMMERNIMAPAGKQRQPKRRYELKVVDLKWKEFRNENPTLFKAKN